MRKNKYFIDLARHKRKEMCIRLKNNLKGKNFYTPFDLSHDEHYWFDIFFLSKKDKCTFYSAVLTSSTLALIESLEDKAFNSWDSLPDSNKIEPFREYRNSKILEYIKSDPPPIYENIIINYNYSYGVELFANLKDEVIASKRVDEFVQEFWANGEQEFCSDTPVQFTKSRIDELIQHAEKGNL